MIQEATSDWLTRKRGNKVSNRATRQRLATKLSAECVSGRLCRVKMFSLRSNYATLKSGRPLPCCPLTCQRVQRSGLRSLKVRDAIALALGDLLVALALGDLIDLLGHVLLDLFDVV